MATKTASDNAATQQRPDDMVSPTRWNDFLKQRTKDSAYTIRGESSLRVLCNDYAAECRFVPVREMREVKSKNTKVVLVIKLGMIGFFSQQGVEERFPGWLLAPAARFNGNEHGIDFR